MIKLKSISPSRLKTWDLCKFKYFLTYHCPDLELKSNWGASIGTLIHDVLEHYVLADDKDWVSRLYRGFGGTLETMDRKGQQAVMESPLRWAKDADFKNQKPHCDICPYRGEDRCVISQEPLNKLSGCPKLLFEQAVSMTEEAIKRYRSVWEKVLRKNGEIIGAEYSFDVPVESTDVSMIGIIDLVVEEDPDTIHVIDYKTGSWTQTYEECREDLQVRMYSLAARREFIDDVLEKGYRYKHVLLTFDYFTRYPITLAFSEDEDRETEGLVKGYIDSIQKTEWITRIVESNDDFQKRWAWKCRSLCDPTVCKDQWNGPLRLSDDETKA